MFPSLPHITHTHIITDTKGI